MSQRGRNVNNFVVVAPVHLAGADAIARAFRVSREEVVEWVKMGMPASRNKKNGRYDGEYNQIQRWREKTFPALEE